MYASPDTALSPAPAPCGAPTITHSVSAPRAPFARRAVRWVLLVALASNAVRAGTVNVTTTADTVGGANVSLRDAFDTANSDGESTTIVLQPGATYQLDFCATDEDANASGDLDHTEAESLTIVGNGATIEQTCVDERVIHNVDTGHVTLENLTMTGGNPSDGEGSGLRSPVGENDVDERYRHWKHRRSRSSRGGSQRNDRDRSSHDHGFDDHPERPQRRPSRLRDGERRQLYVFEQLRKRLEPELRNSHDDGLHRQRQRLPGLGRRRRGAHRPGWNDHLRQRSGRRSHDGRQDPRRRLHDLR